jgi:hypothetical protein
MKRVLAFGLVVVLIGAAVACTNDEGETEAPVFITVDLELQPGFINVEVPAPVQIQTIELQSRLKNPSQTDPQGFADTQITRYTVVLRRTDGGTRVPPSQPFVFGAGVLVPSGGRATLSNFPVIPFSAIQQSPFDQLLPFNGGIDRETGRTEIQTAFDLTFFGQTVSGHRVQSETASGILLFRNSGSTPLARVSTK